MMDATAAAAAAAETVSELLLRLCTRAPLVHSLHSEVLPAVNPSCAEWFLPTPSTPSLLPLQEVTRDNFTKRLASLQRLVCLPPLAAQAYERAAADGQSRALDQLLLHGPWGSGTPPLPEQQRRQQEQGTARAEGEGGGGGMDGSSSRSEEVRARLCEGGVAAWNTDSYETRLRLLALCGWDLKVVAAGGDSGGGEGGTATAAQPQGQPHVGPECSALLCTLCGAKAGLWAFFPSCKPQVQPALGRGLALRGAQSGEWRLPTHLQAAAAATAALVPGVLACCAAAACVLATLCLWCMLRSLGSLAFQPASLHKHARVFR